MKLTTVPVGSGVLGLFEPLCPVGSPLNTAAWKYSPSGAGCSLMRTPDADSGYAGPPPGRSKPVQAGQPNVVFMNTDAVWLVRNSASTFIIPIRTDIMSSNRFCCSHRLYSRVAGGTTIVLETPIKLPTQSCDREGP